MLAKKLNAPLGSRQYKMRRELCQPRDEDMKARAMSKKRRIKEHEVTGPAWSKDSANGADEELLQHLDAELHRLPDKYRVPVVLCELEGRSRKEVARRLGLPEGTLSWRLA